jgi:heme-degrading monooxygenase HmoA
MLIAMNRLHIVKGEEEAFERFWAERDTHLREVLPFVAFNFLKSPEVEDHTLYVSHTIWSQ